MSANAITGPAELREAAPARVGVLRKLSRRPPAIAAAVAIGVLVLGALLAPLGVGSPTTIDTGQVFAAPSSAHLLGTDDLGRDLLARTLDAGRLSLMIALGAMAVSMIVGMVWGFVAAVGSRLVDEALMRVADAAMAIPPILLALVLVAAFGASTVSLALISGLLLAPQTARIVRAATLAELRSDYHLAATAAGVNPARIVVRELLPNAAPPLIAQASLNIAWAIGIEASLSFLGLGLQPPEASWGTLLQEGYANLYRTLWFPAAPAVAIFIAILAFNTLGVQLQRVLDPREDAK